MHYIDYFLNRITMYRLMLYFLLILLGIVIILAFFGLLPFSPIAILFSTFFLISACYIINKLFSLTLKIPTNIESVYITACILALIITPSISLGSVIFYSEVSVLAMASKYLLAIRRVHIFNPAAIAIVITALAFSQAASWWVGTGIMEPFVVIGGFLIVRKIQKESMVLTFFLTAMASSLLLSFIHGGNILLLGQRILLGSSLIFLGFIMLTEPHTTPPTKKLQMLYGGLVGLLFSPQIHFGIFYTTPEIALIIGNMFLYLVSPKQKLLLFLKDKIETSPDAMDFVFERPKNFFFSPGQYMEWTLAHKNPDTRGNRRYFTISSSPTEPTIRIGVKFYEKGSTFKKNLQQLTSKTPLLAGLVAGDFTLPKDTSRKLAFLAGGIGITPFRSMLEYLLDRNEKRDIVLLYANKSARDILYKDIFDSAKQKLGIQTVFTLTDDASVPKNWKGLAGRIDKNMIQKYIPDFQDRIFYLSGPESMVEAYEKVLQDLHVLRLHVKKDFFPGYV